MEVRSHDHVECSAAPPPLFRVGILCTRAYSEPFVCTASNCSVDAFLSARQSPPITFVSHGPCKVETGRDEMALRDNIVTLVAEEKGPAPASRILDFLVFDKKTTYGLPLVCLRLDELLLYGNAPLPSSPPFWRQNLPNLGDSAHKVPLMTLS